MDRTRIGITLFDDVEILDYCGPFEVFSTTRVNEENRALEASPFEVLLVAEHERPIVTTGGMEVLPHRTFQNCDALDILLIPGGMGTRKEIENPVILNWIKERAKEVQTLASVCTGAMLLAKAGLLDGRRATTHWRSLDSMREAFPAVNVDYQKHFIRDEEIYTSAGISAGIDMSLMVVAQYLGEEIARSTAKNMEYPYPDSAERRIDI